MRSSVITTCDAPNASHLSSRLKVLRDDRAIFFAAADHVPALAPRPVEEDALAALEPFHQSSEGHGSFPWPL